MRTCGGCGWWSGEEHVAGWRACHALSPTDESQRAGVWPACVHWKPKQDWREETCGTCEFRGEDITNYVDPAEVIFFCRAGPGVHERAVKDFSCREWEPKEE